MSLIRFTTVKHPTILFVHGGYFVAGSFRSHAGWAAELTQRVNAKTLLVEYRCVKNTYEYTAEHPGTLIANYDLTDWHLRTRYLHQ